MIALTTHERLVILEAAKIAIENDHTREYIEETLDIDTSILSSLYDKIIKYIEAI